MQIKLEEHTIEEVFNGYEDNAESGIVGFGGRLNIRPAFQREFVYKEKESMAVIDTVYKGFPLNVMYWVEDEQGNYELLDGQQRTISICQYCAGDFSIMIDEKPRTFSNLTGAEQRQILDYKLMIYVCKGSDREKLDWFKIINIAGVTLTEQELRNAIYTGEWLTDAKRYFSKNGCAAYKIANKYMNGEMNRQAYLEKAIKWLASRENMTIEEHMSAHQHDTNASTLWIYFQNTLNWIKSKQNCLGFETTYRMGMRPHSKLSFEILYDPYSNLTDDSTLQLFHNYLNDKNAIVKIQNRRYYHALQIFLVKTTKQVKVIAFLDNKLQLKTGDSVIDENDNIFIVKGFAMIRFNCDIPDWYKKASFVELSGNYYNIGHYFAKL